MFNIYYFSLNCYFQKLLLIFNQFYNQILFKILIINVCYSYFDNNYYQMSNKIIK